LYNIDIDYGLQTFQPIDTLFQMQTLQAHDTSTHPLNIFNPDNYLIQSLFLRLVTPYIEDVSALVKPIFTGNKCDPIKNVYNIT